MKMQQVNTVIVNSALRYCTQINSNVPYNNLVSCFNAHKCLNEDIAFLRLPSSMLMFDHTLNCKIQCDEDATS